MNPAIVLREGKLYYGELYAYFIMYMGGCRLKAGRRLRMGRE